MGKIEGDQVRSDIMQEEQENVFTMQNWMKANRYVRYMENVEDEIQYIIRSDEYKEMKTDDLDRKLKAALIELGYEINRWTAVRTRIREVLKEEVEKSKNNG